MVSKKTKWNRKSLWLLVDGQLCPRGSESTLNSCTLLCTVLSLPKKQISSVSKPVCILCSLLLWETFSRIHSSDDDKPSPNFPCKSIWACSRINVACRFKKLHSVNIIVNTEQPRTLSLCEEKQTYNESMRICMVFVHLEFELSSEKATRTVWCWQTTEGDPWGATLHFWRFDFWKKVPQPSPLILCLAWYWRRPIVMFQFFAKLNS